MHQPYPKYKYHRELPPVVVKSVDEEDALEGDWKDSPAHHAELQEESSEQGLEQETQIPSGNDKQEGNDKQKPKRSKRK